MIDYYYWIYSTKDDKYAISKGRASSISECRDLLDHFKYAYGNECVITVKSLMTDTWLFVRQNNI